MFQKIKDFIKTNERIITYALFGIVIIWLLSLKTCNKNSPYANQQSTIDSLVLANQKYDSIVNKKGQKVFIQTSIVTDNQGQLKVLSDSLFNLKRKLSKADKVLAHINQFTNVGVDDRLVKVVDSLDLLRAVDSVNKQSDDLVDYIKANTVSVPRTYKDSSKYFNFKASLSKAGLNIDSLYFPDSTYIRFIEHKGGLFKFDTKLHFHLFKRKSIEAQVIHTNPYVKVTGLQSVFYVPKVKQRWLERAIIAGTASFLTYKLIK